MSTRFTPMIYSNRTFRASSPEADVVAVAEAVEVIAAESNAEDMRTVEEAIEGTVVCSKTTHIRNGRILQRTRRYISVKIGRSRRMGIGTICF